MDEPTDGLGTGPARETGAPETSTPETGAITEAERLGRIEARLEALERAVRAVLGGLGTAAANTEQTAAAVLRTMESMTALADALAGVSASVDDLRRKADVSQAAAEAAEVPVRQ